MPEGPAERGVEANASARSCWRSSRESIDGAEPSGSIERVMAGRTRSASPTRLAAKCAVVSISMLTEGRDAEHRHARLGIRAFGTQGAGFTELASRHPSEALDRGVRCLQQMGLPHVIPRSLSRWISRPRRVSLAAQRGCAPRRVQSADGDRMIARQLKRRR
jgi:hypothetical protein